MVSTFPIERQPFIETLAGLVVELVQQLIDGDTFDTAWTQTNEGPYDLFANPYDLAAVINYVTETGLYLYDLADKVNHRSSITTAAIVSVPSHTAAIVKQAA